MASKQEYSFALPVFVDFQEVVNHTVEMYQEVDKHLTENSIHAYAGTYTVCINSGGGCATGYAIPCGGYTSITCPSTPAM